jgi:hypothetical protein
MRSSAPEGSLNEAKAAFRRGHGTNSGETMEAWIIAAIFSLYPVILAGMYFILAREIRAITNYAVLVLLDEGVHSTQRSSLIELICATEADDAVQLGEKARTVITKVAMRLLRTKLDVNRVAWSLKPPRGMTAIDAATEDMQPHATTASRAL